LSVDQGARRVLAERDNEENRGNWQKAQELYQKALQAEPDYPLAAYNLAYLMLEHGGNTDVALSLAQTARRGLPDSAVVADTLGWAYYQEGIFSTVVDMLNEAVEELPNNPTYHYHLGLAYQKTNDRTRAREHLERALSINPSYPKADEIRKGLAKLGRGRG
jgi:tetratricopeptide (TPR) repeat protein